jgi:hypothetical protein
MTHTLDLEYTFQTITLRPALAVLHRIEAEEEDSFRHAYTAAMMTRFKIGDTLKDVLV